MTKSHDPDKKILLLDMDGILADTNLYLLQCLNKKHGRSYTNDDHDRLFGDHECLTEEVTRPMITSIFNTGNFFRELPPIPGAIEAVKKLRKHYNIHIVTSPWVPNPNCMNDKNEWLAHYLPGLERTCIQTNQKFLIYGDILVDDKTKNLKLWKEFWGQGYRLGAHYDGPTTASLKYHWTDPKITDIIAPNWTELCDHLIERSYRDDYEEEE